MKDDKVIKALLDKYLEGETSLKEENTLARYFKSQEVKPEWQAYKSMFTYYEEAHNEETTEKSFKPEKRSKFALFQKYAAILVICLIGAMFYQNHLEAQNLGTFDDPELALEETIRIFDLIADKFNKGQNEMAHLNSLETPTKYINLITP